MIPSLQPTSPYLRGQLNPDSGKLEVSKWPGSGLTRWGWALANNAD
jgi:hypothetical protein